MYETNYSFTMKYFERDLENRSSTEILANDSNIDTTDYYMFYS